MRSTWSLFIKKCNSCWDLRKDPALLLPIFENPTLYQVVSKGLSCSEDLWITWLWVNFDSLSLVPEGASGSTVISFKQSCADMREKAMAAHSSTPAWKIPWAEEPGGLQSMGSLRVGHDWVTSLSLFTFMHWRRKWQPTPVFLPRESQGRGSLVGCRLWGPTESDTTEET